MIQFMKNKNKKRRWKVMRFQGVIPARYGSSRLEGKPLKTICGHTMIEWVYKRVKKSNLDESSGSY